MSLRTRRALAWAWSLLILAGCTLPGDSIRQLAVFTPDKVLHFAAFFGYALLWRWSGASARVVLLSGLGFALFIEAWQHLLPIGRFADPYDALADAVGLLVGLGVWEWHTRREQRLEG